MAVADMEMVRTARREIARFPIDISEVVISSTHSVIHLTGRVRAVRGHENDFTESCQNAVKCLRQRQGVRDVVEEWVTPEGHKPGVVRRKTE